MKPGKPFNPNCGKCGSLKSASGQNSRMICVPCNRRRASAYQRNNPSQVNAKNAAWGSKFASEGWTNSQVRKLRQRYGISQEEFQRLQAAQDGCCAICRRKPKFLVVDHCHTTSSVRKLLCKQCNFGLGLFRDSPEIMRAAISYLEDHL